MIAVGARCTGVRANEFNLVVGGCCSTVVTWNNGARFYTAVRHIHVLALGGNA